MTATTVRVLYERRLEQNIVVRPERNIIILVP